MAARQVKSAIESGRRFVDGNRAALFVGTVHLQQYLSDLKEHRTLKVSCLLDEQDWRIFESRYAASDRTPTAGDDGVDSVACRAIWSENKGAVQVKDGLCADVLDFVLPIISQIVEAQAVRIGIDQITQALAYSDPASIIDVEFEHGKLDALAKILAYLGNTPQTFFAADGDGAHIVADQNQHDFLSLPQERGISVQVAAQMTGQ
ncbi:hypothetical protein [Ventosimonas gracilis]|uniref:hypothetical protein n=1 Tax=Ventosimonas gracilis TaxID=1680762 RepID=UPI003F6B4E49